MITSIHDFSFEEDTHTYTHAGKSCKSVTGLLKQYGFIDYSFVKPGLLERKRVLGKDVHGWTACYDITGNDDMLSLPEEGEGYARAWMKFRRESGFFQILEVEKPIMGRIYGVPIAGTPDRELLYRRTKRITADLKCCVTAMPWWKVQTASYRMMRDRKCHLNGGERCSIQLFPDGTYDVLWYTDPTDGDAFLAMVALEAWKSNHGVKEPKG